MFSPMTISSTWYAAVFFLACSVFSAPMHACEKPAFEKAIDLVDLSSDEFSITWMPVPDAEHYELKYSIKIPEGRTLSQRERTVEQSAYRFLAAELPSLERFQVLAEVTAQCNSARSEPAFILLSIRREAEVCAFGDESPTITNGELHVPVVRQAQGYLICLQHTDTPPLCKEVNQVLNSMAVSDATWASITPLCGKLPGKTAYVTSSSRP